VNNGVLLNVGNLWHLPDPLNDGLGETTSIALQVTVVHLADAGGSVDGKRVLLMGGLEEVEMVVQGGGVEVILEHDDVRMVEDLVWVLGLEGMEGGERKRGPLPWDVMGCR